ncbi:MAPEG family protein [Thalassotalea sp. 1_MG-2023]|uniref:MAPEG family protein n=1 Tax=Thalassotalea sp. 1_MG-2023 TaxID=3062680 RepID=UPI0026E40C9C|nr:MAPEG family protein [Thalassotalea sp. 1_MG-2023]MDO6426383.1 MAPEG family protein [Thalassotalea sp. 1_MG-2023]
MTILISCLLIALLLPFIAKLPVAIAMHKLGGYNNKAPRSQQAKLTGFGARALAAHQNAFESVIIFAPAVILAIATNHTGELIQQLAVAHIVARMFYHILYLANISTLRSIIWGIGLLCALSIVWQCLP